MGHRVLAALAAAFVMAAGGRAAATASGLELRSCALKDVQGEVSCGVFRVPEDRARAGGRILPLKVIVLKARSATPREPIYFLSGGPGQAATDGAEGFATSWMRDQHDLVLMDVRGSGEGTALDCPPAASEDDLQAFLEPPLSGAERLRACRARLEQNADLTRYDTALAMQDLDELRQALGHDQIDLFGGSYGTRAGLAYIHAYGPHVRLAVMTGLSPFENRSPLYHASAAQRAFDRMAAQCEAEPACKAAFPHIEADLAEVLARLKRAAARVKVTGPTGKAGEVMLDQGAFADGLRVMLYASEHARHVPLLLKRAREGDLAPFAQAALQNGYVFAHGLRTGLLLSVSCPEDVARIRPGDIARETAGTFLGDRRVRDQMAGCAAWPKSAMPAGYFAPFVSQVPALLVSGDLDPVTPPLWADFYRRYLPNSLSLVMPGAHTEGGDCFESIARQFVDKGSTQGIDTSCVAAVKLPPFALE